MISKVSEKLNYSPLLMDAARSRLLDSQHQLIATIDKKITIPINNKEEPVEQPKTLEFQANQWTELRVIIDTLVGKIKNVIGYAQSIVFPSTDIEGAEMIVGYLKSGTKLNTLVIPWNRRIHIIRGVLRVVSDTPKIMDVIKKHPNQTYFTGDNLFIEANECLDCEIIHNIIFLMKFITDLKE